MRFRKSANGAIDGSTTQGSRKRRVAAWGGLACVAAAVVLIVWPTPYRYFEMAVPGVDSKQRVTCRENRITGTLQYLDIRNGWQDIGSRSIASDRPDASSASEEDLRKRTELARLLSPQELPQDAFKALTIRDLRADTTYRVSAHCVIENNAKSWTVTRLDAELTVKNEAGDVVLRKFLSLLPERSGLESGAEQFGLARGRVCPFSSGTDFSAPPHATATLVPKRAHGVFVPPIRELLRESKQEGTPPDGR